MPDTDWTAVTWDGSRREQHRAFLRLPFSEKLLVLEELAATADLFMSRREARGAPNRYPGASPTPSIVREGEG
ncbi:MAG: hypothetical protein IT356_07800 [Gemmatimonadaceae bacterium]|nr:hypothetical protein [Gemmatimonadaceae bacterium]